MRHKGCTKDGEIVYYCFHCGKVIDAPEVEAVLTAAEEYYESFLDEDVERFFRAKAKFQKAVRDYKERNAKDGRKTD